MMANLNSIEREKRNIIKNFKPEEMSAYLENLVAIYYESYIEQDLEKHLTATKLIEEAVEIYESIGYNNTEKNELIFKLNKANEVLRETLIEKDELAKAGRFYLSEWYSNKIDFLIHNNCILRDFIEIYEKAPSEIALENTKHILMNIEMDLAGTKYLLEEKEVPENYPFLEDIEIIREYYSEFLKLQKKINSF